MELLHCFSARIGIFPSSVEPSRRFSISFAPNALHLEFRNSEIHGFSTSGIAFNRANGNSPWRSLPGGVECRTMRVELKNEIEENLGESKHLQRGGLRRKKLAVFVSGGGSNFRAIHRATLTDDIYGDVVVLITDKPDYFIFLRIRFSIFTGNWPIGHSSCPLPLWLRLDLLVVGLKWVSYGCVRLCLLARYKARSQREKGCGASDYARDSDIPILIFPKSMSASSGLSSVDLITTLRQFEIDFLLLAGYLKLLPAELVQAYRRSILNIHPSLLPAFGGKGYYGMKVHKAVIASGARFSGPTVHFVDEKYDTGRILAQRVVPVLANDSAEDLAARVLQQIAYSRKMSYGLLQGQVIQEHLLYVEVVAAICEERIHWRDDGVPLIQKSLDRDEYY